MTRKRTMIVLKCPECNIRFERRKDVAQRYNGVNYCSTKCANKANARKGVNIPKSGIIPRKRTGKVINCFICEKEFYVLPWRLNTAKYCSKKCHGIAKRKQ